MHCNSGKIFAIIFLDYHINSDKFLDGLDFDSDAHAANMPHLSLFYGDLTDEEKKRAVEIVKSVDEGLCAISFTITRVQLYKVNFEDRTQKSWEKVYECNLRPH